ncbi:MAG TPA: RNA polymerase sigma factor [Solirubrobacteraceae bacterium]|nr:RNA polymerase sigma factor [Solirubrobacteraceae bacterium]
MPATATPPFPSLRSGALSRLGDEALARRAATGNDAAFTVLYARYHGPLLGYCRSILLNDEDAHDATQNALENALRALPRRESGRPLRPWLYRIAHNEAINIVRRRRPHAELTELDEPTVPGPEVDSEHRVRLAQLVDDLRGLPERQRGALVMRELSGLSYDDIAIALGVSNEAARRAVFDARSALHEAVDGRATECVSVRHCISDGDRRSLRARRIRAHLRSCNDCASFELAIHARRSDLHLLGPWLSGGAIAGVLGGGAGGGALIAAGGGGAATATVTAAGWTSMPAVLKGLTVAAVVATTGGAAVEIHHVAKPGRPAPKAQAARPAAAAASPAAVALKARLSPAPASTARRARRASATARSARGTMRSHTGTGSFVAPRAGEHVATPAPPATAPAPPPPPPPPAPVPSAPAQPQQPREPEPAPAASQPAKQDPATTAIAQLSDIRKQVIDAIEQAQSIAAAGSAGALQSANTMLQGTLGALRPTIERILARVGLKLPQAAVTPAPPPTTTHSHSLPNVMAPVQQMLDTVDSMLSKLFGRRTTS